MKWNNRLLRAAVLLQLADLMTMSSDQELNPIARHPFGGMAKLLLVMVLIAWAFTDLRYRRPVLVAAVIVGAIGTASNLL